MVWLFTTLLEPMATAGAVPSACPALEPKAGALEGAAGQRRVALVVGVGDYAAEIGGANVDIPAASDDALAMRELLVDTFGFPARNVCVLRDAAATRSAFFDAWDATYGEVEAGDAVVVYFAGHGARTPGGDQTYVLHDSRTKGVDDVASVEIERRLVQTYQRTTDITVLIDASHGGGPFDERPQEVIERWVPPAADAPTAPLPDNPRIAELMPQMVWMHAAPAGMPALEREGHGVFTSGLLRALRGRPTATWDQILHDVTRWTAALHSWQQPTAGGDLSRTVWTPEGAVPGWEVASVKGGQVVLRGALQPGLSEGALLSAGGGTLMRVREAAAGEVTATVIGGSKPKPGRPALLEVPGRDLTSVEVSFQGPTRWVQAATDALTGVVEGDPVLSETVRFVRRGADFVLRPGPDGSIDIVGSDGVRRNRFAWTDPGEGSATVAQALGMYARQSALLALSGEVPADYPRNMFDLRILPVDDEQSCARNPYEPPGRPVPWAQVPMCNAVQLAIRLVEKPQKPLHLGIVYLAGDGTIETWPPRYETVTLSEKGDERMQVLGWVTPPLNTPDRILVFGTHQPVDWARLQGRAPADQVTRGIGADDFFVAAVAGTKNRGAFVQAGHSIPAWTASLVSVEVTADPDRWSPDERESQATCQQLRQSACGAPAKKKKR